MKTATISEAKNKLSQLLDWVKAGETVIITDRDVPVAKLESVQRPSEGEAYGRMERLIRAGVARGPIKPLAKDWRKNHPRIKVPADVDIVKIIAEERESSW
jgi:prevent-host-death family protein